MMEATSGVGKIHLLRYRDGYLPTLQRSIASRRQPPPMDVGNLLVLRPHHDVVFVWKHLIPNSFRIGLGEEVDRSEPPAVEQGVGAGISNVGSRFDGEAAVNARQIIDPQLDVGCLGVEQRPLRDMQLQNGNGRLDDGYASENTCKPRNRLLGLCAGFAALAFAIATTYATVTSRRIARRNLTRAVVIDAAIILASIPIATLGISAIAHAAS